MSHFKIKVPIWKDGGAVGLAEKDMTSDRLTVEIMYKDKAGNRKWPKTYWVPKSVAMRMPIMVAKRPPYPRLRVVPIATLQEDTIPK